MAKRTSRSQAEDAVTAAAAGDASKGSRARARKSSTAQGNQVTADDPTVASAPTLDTTQAARPEPSDEHPPEDTIAADPRVTEANQFDAASPSDEEIRQRAYELYVARGGQHGMDHEDWYRAEQELRRKLK